MNSKFLCKLAVVALVSISAEKVMAQSGDFTRRMNQELADIAQNEGPRSQRYIEGKVKMAISALLSNNAIKSLEEALAIISTHQSGVTFDEILFHLQGHALDTTNPSKTERLLWLGTQIANTFTGEVTAEQMQQLGEIYIEILQNPNTNYGLRIQAALQLNMLAVRRGQKDLRIFTRIVETIARDAQVRKQTYLAEILKAFPYITANEFEVEVLRVKLANYPDAEVIKGIRKVVWIMARLERSGFRSGRLAIANSPIVKAIREGSFGHKEYADLYMQRFSDQVSKNRSNNVPTVIEAVEQRDQAKENIANSNPLSLLPNEMLKGMTFEDMLVRKDITTEDIQRVRQKVIDHAHERELNLRDNFGFAKDFHVSKFREDIRTLEELRESRSGETGTTAPATEDSRFAGRQSESAAERAEKRANEAQVTGESRTERRDERKVGRFHR